MRARRRMQQMVRWMAGAMLCAWIALPATAQVVSSGNGGAASLWVGGEYANFKAGFPNGSSVRLGGAGAFAVFDRDHHLGLEMHARILNMNSWYGETEQQYLIGPRYTFLRRDRLRPFAYFQVGLVRINYPFNMGTGNSFAMAPGGGLEYRLARKWSVRAAYELQTLANSPNFTNEPKFGIKPSGFTMGLSYRVFSKK